MKPLLIIQTSTSYDDLPSLCEKYGDEVDWFSAASGITEDRVLPIKVFVDEILPKPDEVQAVIVTGSVDMISDGHPWIERTSQWLKGAIDKGVPILGVCFGHQLIVHALGGRVGPNPNGAEFGTVSISKTPECEEDILFKGLPACFSMQVFHYESVLELPREAIKLAGNEIDQCHAFRYGSNVWGVQFHPEFNKRIMTHIYDVYGNAIEEAGFTVQALRESTVDATHGQQLLKRFADFAFQAE